jgi:F0F1-type ATP synthase membrane subunit b/b'
MQTPTWLLVLFLGAAALLLVVLIMYFVYKLSQKG